MKITKKFLTKHGICNSYYLAKKVGNKIYIDYCPADNGRLTAHYAFWKMNRIDFIRPDNTTKQGGKTFTVESRDVKEIRLHEAIAWVKRFYNIEITDKDPIGAWHPKGTMAKLVEILNRDKVTK